MESSLASELQARSAGVDEENLLKAIGYEEPPEEVYQRLRLAIKDPRTLLGTVDDDLKHGHVAFLHRLGNALGLETPWLQEQIRILKVGVITDDNAFRPYLFVDTDFVRKSEPIFILALTDGCRHLHFPQRFWRLPLPEQVAQAQERARAHWIEKEGTLGCIWGDIKRYSFHYSPTEHVVINPDGALTAEKAKIPGVPRLGKPFKGRESVLQSMVDPDLGRSRNDA